MSCSQSRQSYETDWLNRTNSGSGPDAKRPLRERAFGFFMIRERKCDGWAGQSHAAKGISRETVPGGRGRVVLFGRTWKSDVEVRPPSAARGVPYSSPVTSKGLTPLTMQRVLPLTLTLS